MENKDPRVSQDSLLRKEKIKRIYEVIMPTYNHISSGIKYKNKCMIGDVLQRIEGLPSGEKGVTHQIISGYNNSKIVDISYCDVLIMWEWKKKPINDQSNDCIDYVYSLID